MYIDRFLTNGKRTIVFVQNVVAKTVAVCMLRCRVGQFYSAWKLKVRNLNLRRVSKGSLLLTRIIKSSFKVVPSCLILNFSLCIMNAWKCYVYYMGIDGKEHLSDRFQCLVQLNSTLMLEGAKIPSCRKHSQLPLVTTLMPLSVIKLLTQIWPTARRKRNWRD